MLGELLVEVIGAMAPGPSTDRGQLLLFIVLGLASAFIELWLWITIGTLTTGPTWAWSVFIGVVLAGMAGVILGSFAVVRVASQRRLGLACLLINLGVVGLPLSLPEFVSTRAPERVEWRGRVLREVLSLTELPGGIRSRLGVDRPGLDGVADRGRHFNVTDVVNPSLPMRRLLTAGTDGSAWLVALELGGIGYSIEVFLYSSPESAPDQRWVLITDPTTLSEVVRQISQSGP